MLIYNSASGRDSSLRYISIDLADPRRNREIRSINFTGLPGGTSNRAQGLAEWQGPDDDGPKLYAGIDNGLYRAVSPPPFTTTSLDWDTYWQRITGPTGFSGIAALSPGPNPGDPLYILDRVLNKIYTWDGVEQREWADNTVGATPGANIVAISDCYSIEWYRGELYVGATRKGTTGPRHPPHQLGHASGRDDHHLDEPVRVGASRRWPRGQHRPPSPQRDLQLG